jgi:protein-disulfide isomerase
VSGALPAVPDALFSRGDYESDSAVLSRVIRDVRPTVIRIEVDEANHRQRPVTVSRASDAPEASMLLDNEYGERSSAVVPGGIAFFRMTPFTKFGPVKPPELGAQDAGLVITEFAEFECPFCKEISETLEQIFSGPVGKRAKLVFRNAPLASHPWARAATEDALCVNRQSQAAFWRLHRRLYADQDTIELNNIHQYVRAFVLRDVALDSARFDSCVSNSESVADAVEDMKLARAEGVHSVPTLIVADQHIEGVKTVAELSQIILQAQNEMGMGKPAKEPRECR